MVIEQASDKSTVDYCIRWVGCRIESDHFLGLKSALLIKTIESGCSMSLTDYSSVVLHMGTRAKNPIHAVLERLVNENSKTNDAFT
jgi:hypothetical protein